MQQEKTREGSLIESVKYRSNIKLLAGSHTPTPCVCLVGGTFTCVHRTGVPDGVPRC